MNTAHDVRIAPDAAQVPPRRLAVIARKRLQEIGIQAFIVGDLVRGRLCLEPRRFKPWPGTSIEASQEFVVQGHDHLWLMKPSVLRFVGAVPFWELRSIEELTQQIERKWAHLHKQSTDFVEQARRYFPNIDLDPNTWTLDTTATDPFGVVNIRVRPYRGAVWVEAIGIDGQPLPRKVERERPVLQLPDEPAMFDEHFLKPILDAVRRGATPTAVDAEPMVLELDIENTSEVHLPADDDSLDLDLDALLTGDLGAPVELDPSCLEVVEDAIPAPLETRAPRLKTPQLSVSVATTNFTEPGTIRDVNAGGFFVSVEDPERYPLDATVVISGLGPFATRARVCHRRVVEEGALLGTGAGIGVELIDQPLARTPHGPAPVVVLTDTDAGPERRARFAAIVSGAMCSPVLVESLPEALVAARRLPVRAVVLDRTYGDLGPAEIADSLRFNGVGAELLVVTTEAPGELPDGVRAVAPQLLSSALIGA